MSRTAETPPPVQVVYSLGYDQFGPVEVHPDACATVLRSYDLNDEQIERTAVLVADEYEEETFPVPLSYDVTLDYPIYSAAHNVVFNDADGIVLLNMGSVRKKPKADVPESAMLIPGLSQRADLALMGEEGLAAEYADARKNLRRSTAIKSIAKSVGEAALGLAVDVAAEVHNIIPTPVAWIAGVCIVGGSAVWANMSSKLAFYQGLRQNDAFKLWPDQKRAYKRMMDYARNPDSPVLLSRPEPVAE